MTDLQHTAIKNWLQATADDAMGMEPGDRAIAHAAKYRIEELEAALKGISECDGQTLLGCAPEHEYEPDLYPEEERAHQYGAYKAFNQCAAIALAALKD